MNPPPETSALPEDIARHYLPDPGPVLGKDKLRPFEAWHAILLRRLGCPVLDIIDGRPVLGGDYDAYASAAFILSLPDDLLQKLWEEGTLAKARDQWLRTMKDPVLLVSIAEVVAAHIMVPFAAFLPFKGDDDGKKKALFSAGFSPSAATSPEPTTKPSTGPSASPSPASSSPTTSSAMPEASSPPAPPPTSAPSSAT